MVEEPATDGDSDHTDSGATVNNKNTCELVVIGVIFLYSGSSMFFNVTCSFKDMGMGLRMIGTDPEILHGRWLMRWLPILNHTEL